MYCEQKDAVINLAVNRAISRARFETTRRNMPLADKEILHANKRPLFDVLNVKICLRQHFPNEQTLSIDESMIPYCGKNALKQHIKGKPIRFGC